MYSVLVKFNGMDVSQKFKTSEEAFKMVSDMKERYGDMISIEVTNDGEPIYYFNLQ